MFIHIFFSRRLFFFILILQCSLSYANEKVIYFGSVAQDTPAVMHKRLLPLMSYLEKSLKRPVKLKLSPNMASAIEELATGKVDLSYLTPVAYIRAHEKGNSKIVVKTVTKGKAAFRLMIVVKQNSSIKTVNDLKGKSFAFGDPAALLQRAAVVGAGVPLKNLGKYEFIGHYDNIARGVVRGLFDAGILKDSIASKWEKKGLRIIYRTDYLPPYNISASSQVNPKLFNEIKKSFLQLNKSNHEHMAVIKSISHKYDGFVSTDNSEYDVVRKLIKPFNQ